ncbi:hypothetical protein BT93_K0306 [Corymbia citriodora subsp. variegata]|nr:hypothetical protein BT93_K0306 [Corymbia citriodora subsp. variegata]
MAASQCCASEGHFFLLSLWLLSLNFFRANDSHLFGPSSNPLEIHFLLRASYPPTFSLFLPFTLFFQTG